MLDGQQRLTVIYSCLGAPYDAPGFQFAYNLETEQIVEAPATPQGAVQQLQMWPTLHIFPLRSVLSEDYASEQMQFMLALQNHSEAKKLQDRLIHLLDVFRSYEIPIITLQDLTVEEVCPIFERINSSGTRLSIYDLVVAATWSKSFNLNRETTRLAEALEPKGFADIEGDTIVKCLSAIQYKSSSRDDILKLREIKSRMGPLVTRTEDALLRTVDFLSTEFGIYSRDFVPYEAIIVILTALFAEARTLTTEQVSRARQWFWRASLSERYRGAADTYVSRDIKTVRDFILGGLGEADLLGEPPIALTYREENFSGEGAKSRAFALALAAKRPKNLLNGQSIDTTDALSIFNKKQFHHIYPKAYLRQSQVPENADALANICMLPASVNRTISDREPNEYLPWIIEQLGDRAPAVFESNFLPDPREVDYSSLTYPQFLELRTDILLREIGVLCLGGHL